MQKRNLQFGALFAFAALSLMISAMAWSQQPVPQRGVPWPQQAAPKSAPAATANAPAASPAKAAVAPAATAAAVDVDSNESRGGWRTACIKDLKQFCRGASGGHAKRECLETNSAKTSSACRVSLDDRNDLRKEARRICRGDLAKLCPETNGGKDELQCLRQKPAELTGPCDAAMKDLAGRL
jgi:hypothetical protein